MFGKRSFNNRLKKIGLTAFTLCEVLIVVGILGLVSELTIPTLMQNIQDAEFKSAWKEEFSVLSQAYTQILSENDGSIKNAGSHVGWHEDSQAMITLFKDKMKVSQYCQYTSSNTFACWHPFPGYGVDSQAVHDKQGNPVIFWGNGYPAMILNNGMLMLLYGGEFQGDSADGINYYYALMAIDVNGKKGPNVMGRDIYIVEVHENKLVPSGSKNCVYNYVGTCNTTGFGCAFDYLYK